MFEPGIKAKELFHLDNSEQELQPEAFEHILRGIAGGGRIAFVWKNAAWTYVITAGDGTKKYVKLLSVGLPESLELQASKLNWLQGKLPVPDVVDYGVVDNYEYLVTLELPGVEASHEKCRVRPEVTVRLVAHGLRRIHGIPIAGCPFDHSIERLMSRIQSNVDGGLIDTEGLLNTFAETSMEKLLLEVERFRTGLQEDLVFTHGDYSMPNIMLADGAVSGFLDLGNCGVADRYYDLAVAEKSIVRNFGADYVPMFFEHYGIQDIDWARIRFYKLIECLVWP